MVACHAHSAKPAGLAVLQDHRFGEHAVDVQSDNPHESASSSVSISGEPAGNTATTDPRSQRIRASRRGGQITARALSPSFKGRPARTDVLPTPHVPDGLTITPIRRSAERHGAETIMPDNGHVEKMNRTIKDATVKRFDYETHDQL